jgi:hypothetical protein
VNHFVQLHQLHHHHLIHTMGRLLHCRLHFRNLYRLLLENLFGLRLLRLWAVNFRHRIRLVNQLRYQVYSKIRHHHHQMQ